VKHSKIFWGSSQVGNIVFGLAFLFLGIVFLVFNKFVARLNVEMQNDFFGFHFGERERKASRVISIIGGIIFTALGALVLLSALSFI